MWKIDETMCHCRVTSAQCQFGETALQLALRHCKSAVAAYLLWRGAERDISGPVLSVFCLLCVCRILDDSAVISVRQRRAFNRWLLLLGTATSN